jgi:NADH-quinone oxidoreductase subunit M
MTTHLLSIIVGAPALAALALFAVPSSSRLLVRAISLAGAFVSLAGSLGVVALYDSARGGFQLAETYPFVPRLGIDLRFAVDGWGAALIVLTALIIVGGIFASWKLERRDKEFFITLLVLVAGVFGVFLSQDLFVFFLFYEIAVLPMYLLIGIWGSSHAITEGGPFRYVWRLFDIGGREYAAMKLTLMLLAGSALVLLGILALYNAAGGTTFDLAALGAAHYDRSLQLWAFPLLWIGFGSLAGVFPFHTWSPDGHASAPTAVSMLHAGVLMKLGAFGVIRVGMLLLPEGAQVWAPVVGFVAVINVVYGAFCAMHQEDLKYVVAYSSVSHMGVVMLGAAALNPEAWNGAVFQMVAHGVMTGLLFALVGLVYERAHTRDIAKMGGLAAVMPGVAAFFTLACLSSLGLPGTAGFAAEFLVFLGAWKSAASWWAVCGAIGAFVTAIYVLSAARRIFWGPITNPSLATVSDARRTEWAALWILGAAIVVMGFWPRIVTDLIDPTTTAHLRALYSSVAVLP